MGRGGTSSRIELGAKKREMEVKGSIYNYDKWTCSFVSPWSRLGGACQTLPRHFSLLNSHSHWPSPAHPIPSPLRGISASTYTIVDRDPLPSPKQCSIPPFSLVSVTTFPLSSDFSHPFRMSRPTTPRTRRPNVTNHIIQSHLRSQDPRPSSTRILLCLAASSFNSPRFSHLASPHFHLPTLRALRTQTVARHVLETLPITRFFVRYTDSSDRFKPGPPDETLYSDAHVKCSRASGDTLFVLSRRRNSFLFRLAALASITASSPIRQLSASMHSSPPIRPTY